MSEINGIPSDRIKLPATVSALLVLFGAAQFFVRSEPGLPEVLLPIMLLFVRIEALLNPPMLLMIGSNLMAMWFEFASFNTIHWSIISLYLTLSSIALVSIFMRFDRESAILRILVGGSLGATLSLAALLTPLSAEVYRYGIRYTGFFKDPNVTAPTALFFAILLVSRERRYRILSVPPFIVFALAISRATFLAFIGVLFLALVLQSRRGALLSIPLILVAVVLRGEIEEVLNAAFSRIGRGGLVNGYDTDRSGNWSTLLKRFDESHLALGPGYSETNGMSVHSTYLRLLVEQGVISLVFFTAAMLIAWRMSSLLGERLALAMLLMNGAVVDATHWRVLFIAFAVCLSTGVTRPILKIRAPTPTFRYCEQENVSQ